MCTVLAFLEVNSLHLSSVHLLASKNRQPNQRQKILGLFLQCACFAFCKVKETFESYKGGPFVSTGTHCISIVYGVLYFNLVLELYCFLSFVSFTSFFLRYSQKLPTKGCHIICMALRQVPPTILPLHLLYYSE